jgi:sugar/nucleoside kinase (ribokinase family)
VKRFDISVVGELNADLILYGLPPTLEPEHEHLAEDFAITLGSSSAIFAHNISLLGSRVGFTSCIGDDPLGKFCVERLKESGVDVSGVKALSGKTTGVTVILPLSKQRQILTYLGTTLDLQFVHLDLNYLRSASHFHLSSFFLLRGLRPGIPELFSQLKLSGLTTSLDTNDDPEDLWADDVKSVLKSVDIFLPNEREACKLTGAKDVQDALEALSQLVPIVVIKCGPKGVIAKRGKNQFHAPSLSVQPMDTVGAGDSFNAGFLHKFILRCNLEECLKYGNAIAALSTTRAGGTEALRDRQHRETFLQASIGSRRGENP